MAISNASDISGYDLLLGLRKLRGAYAGSCIRIRRSSDSTEQDIGFDGNGDLDAAAAASFIGGGSGFVVTWYDQSGSSRDFTQATTTKQPLYVASGMNSLPTVRFDGTDDLLRCGSNFSSATAGSLFILFQLTTGLTANQFLFNSADEATDNYYWAAEAYASTQPSISMQQRNNDTASWTVSNVQTASGTPYLAAWKSSGTAWSFRNGTIPLTLTDTGAANGGDWLGDTSNRDSFTLGALKRTSEALFFKGDVREVLLYDSDLSSGDTVDVEDYIRAGFTDWLRGASITTATADVPAVPYNDKIYLFGGYGTSASNILDNTQIYTPATNSWAAGTAMTTARWGAAAAEVGGVIYVFGGATDSGGTRSAKCEAYDVAGNSWTTKTDLPGATFGNQGVMAVTVGSLIYLFHLDKAYVFDPAGGGGAGSYTALTDAPVSKTWSVCAYVDVSGEDRIYIIGGAAAGGSTSTTTNYYYVPGTDTWSSAQTAAPSSVWGATRDNPVYDGLIYLVAGQTSAGIFATNMYAFDPSANTWSSAMDHAVVPRDGLGCAVTNGTLYLFGGRGTATGFGFDHTEYYVIEDLTPPVTYQPRAGAVMTDGFGML